MIQEIINFVDNLDEDFKLAGLKPKEGLHILLKMEESGGKYNLVDIKHELYNKKMEDISSFLEKCAVLRHHAWMIDTNKCFDLPKKAIHSCSPFCVAFKREHLEGGKKYVQNEQKEDPQIHERLGTYFEKAHTLLNAQPTSLQKAFEYIFTQKENRHYFESLLSEITSKLKKQYKEIEDHISELKERYRSTKEKEQKNRLKSDIKEQEKKLEQYKPLSDSDYICFYLDLPIEIYKISHQKYLKDKLFNKADYNTDPNEEGVIWGVSNFFNSIDSGGKKPFLKHQTALFEITGRISSKEAQILHLFQEILSRKTLPSPLPLFIYKEELQRDMVTLFQRSGYTLPYQEIIKALWKSHKDDLANYYLLFWYYSKDGLVFKDFDFVSHFEYLLQDEEGQAWQIHNLFEVKEDKKLKQYPKLDTIFKLEKQVFYPLLQNKYKKLDYFSDLNKKDYEELPNSFFNSSKYRKPVYDYIYKSQRQAISGRIFDELIFGSIGDDLKNGGKNDSYAAYRIKEKLNYWFSLYEKFHSTLKYSNTMANQLKSYQDFVSQLAETGDVGEINSPQYFAFAAGQVIYYIHQQSESGDKSFHYLESYLQQSNCERFKAAISKSFDRYKHKNFSKRFKNVASFVLAFETEESIKQYMPEILAGVFANNQLYASQKV